MDPRQKQGMILGLIVGLALFAFFWYTSNGAPICFILIPIGAVMGVAPQLLKPVDVDDDDD